jgi:hypothetical protein
LVIGKNTPGDEKATPQIRYINNVQSDNRTKHVGDTTRQSTLTNKIIRVNACSEVIPKTLTVLQEYFELFGCSDQEQTKITNVINAHTPSTASAEKYEPSVYVVWINQTLKWIEPIGSWSQLKFKLQLMGTQSADPMYSKYQETFCDGCGGATDKKICDTL